MMLILMHVQSFVEIQDIERKWNSDIIQGPLLCNEMTKMDA